MVTVEKFRDLGGVTLLLTCLRHLRRSYLSRSLQIGLLSLLINRHLVFLPASSITPSLTNGRTLLHEVIEALELIPGVFRSLVGDIIGLLVLISVVGAVAVVVDTLTSPHLVARFKQSVYDMIRDLPQVRAQVRDEQHKLESELDVDLKQRVRGLGEEHRELPSEGIDPDVLLSFLRDQVARENKVWQNGRVSGAVYYGDDAHTALLNEAFGLYSIANRKCPPWCVSSSRFIPMFLPLFSSLLLFLFGSFFPLSSSPLVFLVHHLTDSACVALHPETWPSGMKLESEVISMTAALVQGDCATVCGCTTSGGTESIVLAIKAHRDWHRRERGVTRPELVCGESAHAAVDKA